MTKWQNPAIGAKTVTSTGRLYAGVHRVFAQWCESEGICTPDHHHVARYLEEQSKNRGPSVVPLHLSAITDMFRSEGRSLDTKSDTIQQVMIPIRLMIKKNAIAKAERETTGYRRIIEMVVPQAGSASVMAEIAVAASNRLELANSLRLIAADIERESRDADHWGGHHGRDGSYAVSLWHLDDPPDDNI